MKEHALLLSAPMVRAALAGAKTVTRRILSQRNTLIDGKPWSKSKCKWKDITFQAFYVDEFGLHVPCVYGTYHVLTPIYQPGDVVWFKETWTSAYLMNGYWGTAFRADGSFVQGGRQHLKGPHFHAKELGEHVRWRSCMFLPRWACRLVRPIISARIEYLQDITEEQAKAEGIHSWRWSDVDGDPRYDGKLYHGTGYHWDEKHPDSDHDEGFCSARSAFRNLWDSINADRDKGIYSWESNPLVIAIEFGNENIV